MTSLGLRPIFAGSRFMWVNSIPNHMWELSTLLYLWIYFNVFLSSQWITKDVLRSHHGKYFNALPLIYFKVYDGDNGLIFMVTLIIYNCFCTIDHIRSFSNLANMKKKALINEIYYSFLPYLFSRHRLEYAVL
jgi:hypothetical protein